ncbi:Cytochrome P450 monooxygenase trt6 [Fusarium culmorum]|uniref:Cytochrome P450 monooxygenase trt6 n=1 Tax=Fusarium culmorum TaxID=5516 RepID=A0A2T4GFP6_FUSCU|nr:Cytochrome P450 monooxygenase trt6 [Fusarium culmorum]
MLSNLNIILDNHQYAILCSITLFTIFIVRYSFLDRNGKYPFLNPKKAFELTTNRVVSEFIGDSKNILAKGRALYKDQPYRANTDWGEVVIIPPQFLSELKSHKDLNFQTPAEDVVNKHLTKALTKVTGPLSEEASLAFRDVFTNSTEWHEMQPSQDFIRIVSRMSSRVFMGEGLCRNEEWVKLSADYTVQAFMTGDILRAYPRWARPYVHHFLPSCQKLRSMLEEARQCLKPFLEKRNAIKAEVMGKGKPCPFDDSIEWFEQEYEQHDPAISQIALSLVAIHTTTDLLTETVFNIALNPELFEPLRHEIISVITTDGLKKTALYNLKLMDSVIKERLATADVTLPNGDVIKKGTRIVCDTTHMWNSEFHENGDKFDGYRYLRMREASEQDKNAHPHLVSPSVDHLGFGYGNHACPGRFFAANELKIALCHMLLKYDWKLADGVVPKASTFGMMQTADSQAKLLIRRRTEELYIDAAEH